jgi:hypothetical protein
MRTQPLRVAVATGLTLLTAACGSDREPIGGGWYTGQRASVSMDDRGAKGMLSRRVGGEHIDVGRDVYEYRFYAPDCVVWQTGRTVFGACGDRRPFPVAISGSLDWRFLDDRIDYLGHFEVLGGRKPPERPRFILIDSVRAVAARQPALNESYEAARDGGLDFDPSLEPMLGRPIVPDLEDRDVRKETPLFRAVRQHQHSRVRTLLDAGANTNVRNDAGMTPLMVAVLFHERRDTTTIPALIAAGADVNAKDDEGRTALMYAVLHASPRVINELLAAGANVFPSDNDWKTATDHARDRGDPEIIALIAEAKQR